MRIFQAVILSSLTGLLTVGAVGDVITSGDLPGWRDDGSDAAAWQPRPDWLSNADAEAVVTSDGREVCFDVPAAGKGMKWSRPIRAVTLDDAPYLVLRYRAQGLRSDGDDYLVYIDDDVPEEECRPIRLCDAVADGQWHNVVVDARAAARGDAVGTVAIQVQAGASGAAKLWIDRIGFAQAPPSGAEVIRPKLAESELLDAEIDFAQALWTAQPTWLANPAQSYGVARVDADNATVFRVDASGLGMKWYWPFDQDLRLAGHRYLVMHYRAENLGPYHDYVQCFLGAPGDGSTYEEVVRGFDLRSDGRWRTVVVPLLEAARRIPVAYGMAIQVQAAKAPAELTVAGIRLVSKRPPVEFTESVPHRVGAQFDGFHPVDLAPVLNQGLEPVRNALGLADWPGHAAITAFGVPFRLAQGDQVLAATGIGAETALSIPVNARTGEVFVLLAAVLQGEDEPVFGGGTFRRIGDVDRFRLRLAYDDGTTDEWLPGNASTGRFEIMAGPQVVCAPADEAKVLKSVTLCDATAHGGFAVAALTCRTEGAPLFPEFSESRPPPTVKRWPHAPAPGTTILAAASGGTVRIENNLLRLHIDPRPEGGLSGLYDKMAGRHLILPERPRPWFAVTLEGKPIAADQLRLAHATAPEDLDTHGALDLAYDLVPCPGVQLRVQVGLTDAGALRFRGDLVNRGDGAPTIGLVCPQIGPYVLGEDLASNEYVYPCRAALIGSDEVDRSARYGGLFGVQFIATVDPAAGQGLYLRTEDTTCIERTYVLRKGADGMFMAIGYPERSLAPGETRPLADTVVAVADGDWHAALEDYRGWLATWYRPAAPRKAWFREAFNFRQRFLHWLDPLYDPQSGAIDLPRALDEAREHFGGLEYLHLFDWGNCGPHGRIYGRVGDYSPYDFIQGGRQHLHDAIAGVRERGTPVGLYIEGYLLDERGKLGRAHGPQWQLRRPDGQGARWPNSSEIFMCPGVETWREVQSKTYAAKVSELDVDGMYIDQFGFTGSDKDCYSPDHGHPVPSYPVLTELKTTKAIRRALDQAKPGVAVYTEESPCDVTSQYQDGSFTYEMNQCHARRAAVPISLFRFAVPDFKTFEILVCDKPTGSWATGVRWTFFNGEGLWLEGPADEWFTPDTLAVIRKCHAILRRHREAFTSLECVPLVSTLVGGVWANYFPADGKEVWTLYNARHRSVRGPVLEAPHREGWIWHDAWHDRPAQCANDGPLDRVATEIGPHGVGCLVRAEQTGR